MEQKHGMWGVPHNSGAAEEYITPATKLNEALARTRLEDVDDANAFLFLIHNFQAAGNEKAKEFIIQCLNARNAIDGLNWKGFTQGLSNLVVPEWFGGKANEQSAKAIRERQMANARSVPGQVPSDNHDEQHSS